MPKLSPQDEAKRSMIQACERGDLAAVKRLAAQGTKLDVRWNDGRSWRTPLKTAAASPHLKLLAYLVDHVSMHWSFVVASATSILLVTTYLRGVAGTRSAVARAGVAQLVFLVLFSYAFFFEGYTGLTVTIGAIVTLFVLMQSTVRVDWDRVFAREVVR